MKTLGGMEAKEVEARWDDTVALFLKDGWDNPGVGIVQRATKHFIPGDVVVLAFMNGGGQRQPAWCCTRKGWSVRRLFVEYCNYHNDYGDVDGRHARADQHVSLDDEGYRIIKQLTDRSTIFLLEPPPGGANGVWPSLLDAAVRRYVVESTCAWHAASRVGASSPVFSQLGG